MKRVNALYRKGDAEELKMLGLDLERLQRDVAAIGLSWVKVPYESYQLTNLGTRIRADKNRIDEIKARRAKTAKADAAGGRLVEITGDWARVTFAEKPERSVLDALRAAGFSWGGGSWGGKLEKLPAMLAERSGSDERII